MSPIALILISIFILLILFGILAIFLTRGKKHKTDYYSLFIMGIIWIGAGIPLGINSNNWALFAMGIIFMIAGLANKDKWKQNHKTWKNLNSKEKKQKIILMIILGAFVLIGVVAGLFVFYLLN
ncbi:hypothetical protein K9L16_02130 [Candidatus Pacearchaeota archaeon]|nr:hypothetical protein [Candidatus Pacearchaeota archaeon]